MYGSVRSGGVWTEAHAHGALPVGVCGGGRGARKRRSVCGCLDQKRHSEVPAGFQKELLPVVRLRAHAAERACANANA